MKNNYWKIKQENFISNRQVIINSFRNTFDLPIKTIKSKNGLVRVSTLEFDYSFPEEQPYIKLSCTSYRSWKSLQKAVQPNKLNQSRLPSVNVCSLKQTL